MNEEISMTQTEFVREVLKLRREGWSDTKILDHLLEIIGGVPPGSGIPHGSKTET